MPEEAAAPEEAAKVEAFDTSWIGDALAGSVREAIVRYDTDMEAASAWPPEDKSAWPLEDQKDNEPEWQEGDEEHWEGADGADAQWAEQEVYDEGAQECDEGAQEEVVE